MASFKWPPDSGSTAGNVVGPGASIDNAVARYNGTTGESIQDSLVTISDTGSIALPALQTVDGRDVSVDGTALDSHIANVANPHVVTKTQVGLSNVDNTTDAGKPVSTAQATAIAAALATANSYTDTEVAALVDSAPATLDTLNELAAALGDDPNFATTVATSLGNRLRVDTAAQGLTGAEKTNAKTNIDLQNVDNTSDATKNAASVSLTNHTINADLNTITNIENADIKSGAAIAYSKLNLTGAVVAADLAGSIPFTKLEALTSAHILVGNGSNVVTDVAMSGDVTISNTGVTAIGSGVIVDSDVNSSAAIAGSKLVADTTIVTGSGTFGAPTNIGNFTNVTSFSLSPGRWLITASNTFGGVTGPTAGLKEIVISAFSGTTTTDHVLMVNRVVHSINGTQTFDPVLQVTWITNVASTTTHYLKIKDSGGTTHSGSYGYIATRLVG